MSFSKSVPKGLKLLECKHGIGGKKSLIHYVPEKDPVQEAFERNKKINFFKLTLTHISSELKVTLWVYGTPEQFILHGHSASHACKQMEHGINFSKAKEAVANAILDLELKKDEYMQVCNSEKRQKGTKEKAYPLPAIAPSGCKVSLQKATQALDDAKLAITMGGAKAFKLYGDL
jgi:hypothetical protein